MERKKAAAYTAKPSQVTDSRPEWVRVRVTRSFDLMTLGEELKAPLGDRLLSLITGGFMEVIEYGPSTSGPGPAGTGDQGGEPEGAAPESPAGAEQGEDPRAG